MRDEQEMKDSGIDWIAYIPNNWKVNVLFQVTSQVKNKNLELKEQNLLSLSYGKIKRKDINTNEGLLPASFENYNIVEKDDIVLRLTDLQNDHKSLRVGHVNERGIITSAYVTLHPNVFINSNYLYYVLHMFDLKKGFYGMGAGVRQGLTYDEVKTLKICYPSMLEQQAIANYLDDRCSKIDTIIAEAKASIEEYNELKQAVIYEAVTKGLDKNVEMKDSGVEWIGVIPYDWHLEKINHVGVTSSGATPARHKEDEYFSNANISWIKTLDLNDGHVKYSSEKITLEALNSSSCSLMPVGTVCVAMYGGAGTIGKSGILDFECATNQAICSIVCNDKKQVGRYLQYQLQAMRSYWMKYAVGTRKDPNISQQTVAQMKVLVPPISTQRLIADYLDDKIMDLESLISEKQSLIEDLEAYKKSLIYEVVTGKRKVVA